MRYKTTQIRLLLVAVIFVIVTAYVFVNLHKKIYDVKPQAIVLTEDAKVRKDDVGRVLRDLYNKGFI